jgi:precorrin-6B methylase 2
VRADREQVERCREVADPADFYEPLAHRFSQDPRRSDDEVLAALLAIAREDDTWLDVGAGGGRYALPLALRTRRVIALEPSAAMREVLRSGMTGHGIGAIDVIDGRWPLDRDAAPTADVVLMAHVGYDIEDFDAFLNASERAARRSCVAIMSEGAMTTTAALLWRPIHGEDRVALPALPELLVFLLARGQLPRVVLAQRDASVFETRDDLLAMARRQLWLRPGSEKDQRLQELVSGRATQREGGWALDWRPTRVGIVSWEPAAGEPAAGEPS